MDLPTEPDGVRQLRDVTRAELAEHVRICRSLIDQLDRHVATTEQLAATLGDGSSFVDALERSDLPEIRPSSTAAVAAFEHSRHHGRLLMMAVALAEGASDEQLRRWWQVSNELVRRSRREIDALPDPTD